MGTFFSLCVLTKNFINSLHTNLSLHSEQNKYSAICYTFPHSISCIFQIKLELICCYNSLSISSREHKLLPILIKLFIWISFSWFKMALVWADIYSKKSSLPKLHLTNPWTISAIQFNERKLILFKIYFDASSKKL